MAEHGTRACYKKGCDRPECGAAARAYDRHVRKLKAYGRWEEPFTDAGPVRDHVNTLRAAGMGCRRICELSGVSTKALSALLYGTEGRPPSRNVRIETARRLLGVQAALEFMLPCALVDATGTRRRLQALVAIGWSQHALARLLGLGQPQVGVLVRGRERTTAATALAVRDLYERMWDTAPPSQTPTERRAVTIARGIARRRGWVPPMAWDDIDDPNAEPVGAGYKPCHGKLPDPDDLAHLIAGGDSLETIADRYGANVSSVWQRLHRDKKEGAAA